MDLAGPRIKITPVTGMPLSHITEPRISGAGRWLKPVYERVLAVPLLKNGTFTGGPARARPTSQTSGLRCRVRHVILGAAISRESRRTPDSLG